MGKNSGNGNGVCRSLGALTLKFLYLIWGQGKLYNQTQSNTMVQSKLFWFLFCIKKASTSRILEPGPQGLIFSVLNLT